MRRLRKENAELREEMEKLRKRNAEIDAMGQVFQGDALAQVLEHTKTHPLQSLFNEYLCFDDFVAEYEQNTFNYKIRYKKNPKQILDLYFSKIDERLDFDFHETIQKRAVQWYYFWYEVDICAMENGWICDPNSWSDYYNPDSDVEAEKEEEEETEEESEVADEEEAGAPAPAPSPPAAKRTYKCSVCGITGHNKTTCPQKK